MVLTIPQTKLRKIFGKPVVAFEDESKYNRRKERENVKREYLQYERSEVPV